MPTIFLYRPCTIYELLDPATREVRYVGKTTRTLGSRLSMHISAARLRPTSHRSCWIRSVGTPLIRAVCVVNESFASEMEQRVIATYRQSGYRLVNTTSGGEGAEGFRHTPESREKMREAWKTRGSPSAGTRAKMSASLRGHRASKGADNPLFGIPRTAEIRARIKASNIGKHDRYRMSAEERTRTARHAAQVRWANRRVG